MKTQIAFFALLMLIFGSCKVSPEPINYGSDVCHYCSMTIVDKQHAAEYVTKKGRAFKFDSIECMINGLTEVDRTEISLYLVNDYGLPGELIDASKATFLVSKNIPSPMGAFLSAFGNHEHAKLVQEEQSGQLFGWEELPERL
jgi:copper chaperone NosL